MVTILTSHHKIWNVEKVIVSIIKEYLEHGCVVVDLNMEGPCAESIGLYALLDDICEKLNFCKKNITINTCNFEEQHKEYKIIKQPQHWIGSTLETFDKLGFVHQKNVTKNLFGCFYNVPSWDRLSLLAYINFCTKNQSMLFCNGVWQGARYNSYYLNDLVDFHPTQVFRVMDFLKTLPESAFGDVIVDKPVSAFDLMKVTEFYNDFFIDIVAETYTHGLSFFITEKTIRPICTLTPFIIQGPKSYLRTLKSDYDVRSFDKWWPEDYDNYNGPDRIDQIFKTIDYIDGFSIDDRVRIYEEMQPTLIHNFNQFQKFKRHHSLS
jgi:hypothetical protein